MSTTVPPNIKLLFQQIAGGDDLAFRLPLSFHPQIVAQIPPRGLLSAIWSEFQDIHFVEATGIDFPVTMMEQARTNDINEIRTALRKHGLDLGEGKCEQTVVVVRDK